MEGFFLDIKQISLYLNIKPSLTYALVESKEIPHYRVGRLIRFKKEEVDRWIEGHKVPGFDTKHRAKRASRSLGQSRKKVDDS